jgi:Ribbon-helix-helix domain
MARKVTSGKSKKDKGLHTRVVVLVSDDQQAWLQAQSEATGAPVSNIVRRAVEDYRERLTKRKAAKPKPAASPEPNVDNVLGI